MSTLSPVDFLKLAHQTAYHFGFTHIQSLKSPERAKKMARIPKVGMQERRIDAFGGALVCGVTNYLEKALHASEPAFFFSTQEMPRTKEIALNLQIVGVKKSIAESILIQTIRSLIRDAGYPNTSIRINSLGDNDSTTRYLRELTSFFKKRLEDMPPHARELMKESVLTTLLYLIEHDHEIAAKSPSPLEYLSDASRRHFREIIEHLDMTETPYEIDTRLVGHNHCYSDAIFSLDVRDEENNPIAEAPFTIRGGRIDAFTKRILKVDVPATGAVIILNSKKAPARMPQPKIAACPSVFLVQLGFGPKIRSLMLVDTLRHAGIRAHQAFASDSLGEQLRQAETLGVPYSLILGQKEYVENSVIVRDMTSRSQEHVPFPDLVPHLRRTLKIR